MKSIQEEVFEELRKIPFYRNHRKQSTALKSITLTQQIQKQRILKILEDRKEELESSMGKKGVFEEVIEEDDRIQEINKLIKEIWELK